MFPESKFKDTSSPAEYCTFPSIKQANPMRGMLATNPSSDLFEVDVLQIENPMGEWMIRGFQASNKSGFDHLSFSLLVCGSGSHQVFEKLQVSLTST